MAKAVKTNAVRLLERAGVAFQILALDASDATEKKSGTEVAALLGVPASSVGKTLVTRGASGRILIFVIPADERLDLTQSAKAAGEKKLSPVGTDEVFTLTGYRAGGCSPLAMRTAYQTFIDAALVNETEILVSAGALGLQIEIAPKDLLNLTGATVANLTRH